MLLLSLLLLCRCRFIYIIFGLYVDVWGDEGLPLSNNTHCCAVSALCCCPVPCVVCLV